MSSNNSNVCLPYLRVKQLAILYSNLPNTTQDIIQIIIIHISSMIDMVEVGNLLQKSIHYYSADEGGLSLIW